MEAKTWDGFALPSWENVGENMIGPIQKEKITKISNQHVPLDCKWKQIPIESCIYKQNKISKSSMSYFLNNYKIESVFICQ